MYDKKITENNMPDGEYIGVISDIKATKRSKRYCIDVKVNIWENDSLQTYIKSFRTIFGLGREKFQEFCDDFELYDEDYRLDLSKALGKVCIAEFDLHNGFNKIKPARKKDVKRIDFKSAFGNLEIANDVDDMPELIENYYFFDYDEDAYEDDVEYYGIIKSWNCYPNKDNRNDYDVCVKTAKSGRTYIRSVDYFMCDDEYEEKQYRLWAQDYTRLMNMSDEEFAMCDF